MKHYDPLYAPLASLDELRLAIDLHIYLQYYFDDWYIKLIVEVNIEFLLLFVSRCV